MGKRRKSAEVVANGRGGTALALELHLSRPVFATGRNLSGVVVFRLTRPTSIRSLTVSVSGRETPTGASLSRAIRRTSAFFSREVLLSGMDQPRFAAERISQLWNAILKRDNGRELSAGEHTYPFSIPLPASLPSSYKGKAGRIDYVVAARVQYPAGLAQKTGCEVPVVAIPRAGRAQPVALSYPTVGGTVQTSAVSVNIELADRSVRLGGVIPGRFSVENPNASEITEVKVSLETCEWVRLTTEKELKRQAVDSRTITPDDPSAPAFESGFELRVPPDASPSIQGTSISVIWFLKLNLNTDPPLELKAPITVYAPPPEEA
jgi:hypothetical protein